MRGATSRLACWQWPQTTARWPRSRPIRKSRHCFSRLNAVTALALNNCRLSDSGMHRLDSVSDAMDQWCLLCSRALKSAAKCDMPALVHPPFQKKQLIPLGSEIVFQEHDALNLLRVNPYLFAYVLVQDRACSLAWLQMCQLGRTCYRGTLALSLTRAKNSRLADVFFQGRLAFHLARPKCCRLVCPTLLEVLKYLAWVLSCLAHVVFPETLYKHLANQSFADIFCHRSYYWE
mmetsp:Transcript_28447/g.45678  ORF Transcript_28447/g.45678 Transcript_28447/m.45678 type:complete len:233 (+) Transcript_28447:287-985(+)